MAESSKHIDLEKDVRAIHSRVFEHYRPVVADWEGFLDQLAQPLPPCIWTNPLRTDPIALERKLKLAQVLAVPLAWYPGAFRFEVGTSPGQTLTYLLGHYHIQEEVSLIPPLLLDPQPGERILDLCAAPGNKTAQMAVRMNNTGTLIANDVAPARMFALRRTLDRLGIMNVSTTRYAGNQFPGDPESYDRILVDAPCSCEGTSRKNPEVLSRFSARFHEQLPSRQLQILKRAVQLCRKGGRIVYSTCTYAPSENEGVVDNLLNSDVGTQVDLLPSKIDGLTSDPGIPDWEGQTFSKEIRHCLRVWPHQNDTGGFFVATFQKKAG